MIQVPKCVKKMLKICSYSSLSPHREQMTLSVVLSRNLRLTLYLFIAFGTLVGVFWESLAYGGG